MILPQWRLAMPQALGAYVDLNRLFKYGELSAFCKACFADGPKNTREIATYVLKAKGLDAGDKVMAKSMCWRLNHALRRLKHSGKVVSIGPIFKSGQ